MTFAALLPFTFFWTINEFLKTLIWKIIFLYSTNLVHTKNSETNLCLLLFPKWALLSENVCTISFFTSTEKNFFQHWLKLSLLGVFITWKDFKQDLSILTSKMISYNLQLKILLCAVIYMPHIKLGRHPFRTELNTQEHA